MRVAVAFCTAVCATAATAASLLFHAPLDGSPVAAAAAGAPTPIEASGLDWGDGPFPGTRALRMAGASLPRLAYAAGGNLPREGGTVALWTRREWPALPDSAEQPFRTLFATPMPNGLDKGRIGSGALWLWWQDSRLRADQGDAADRYVRFDGIDPADTNWMHVAFSWRPGRCELFVNGRRRRTLRDGDSPIRDALAEAEAAENPPDRSAIDRFFVGCSDATGPADSLIADLRIYDAPLTEEEVRALAGDKRQATSDKPVETGDRRQATRLSHVACRAPLEPPLAPSHTRASLPGEAPGTIAPEALALEAEWSAAQTDAGKAGDAFNYAGDPPALRTLVARDGRLPAGQYLEAGSRKGDRFAVRLRLAAGTPLHLVEIDVPDDTLRTEDLIIQPCDGSSDYAMQTGIMLGGEYPNSGGMLTLRRLYWARTNDVALVAMTARDGAPAAVAAVRAYAVKDAALPVGFAAGAPAPATSRHAALYYEDPALNFEFGFTTREAGDPAVFAEEVSRLAATMKFAGVDTLFYPGAWYQGLIGENGYNPRNHAPRWRETLYGAFDAEALRFIPTVNLNNIPWEPGAVTAESLANGALRATPIAIHDTGKPNPGLWHNTPPNYNFLHPAVQAEIERVFDALVVEGAGHPSFGGVCLHLTQHCCLWWGSDKSGYNDYCIKAFCRDTGRDGSDGRAAPAPHASDGRAAPAPHGSDGQAAPGLYGREAAAWLRADPARWEAWLQWRCDQVTAFYARLASRLAAAHPGATLYLNHFVPPDLNDPAFLSDPDFTRNAARRAGLDVPALEAAIPNLCVMQTSIPADIRWGYADRYFRFETPERRAAAIERLRSFGATPGFWAPLAEASRPWANQHDRYWESAIGRRDDSLTCDWMKECTWRVSTLDPGGDNTLRHWLEPLRLHDALGLSKGGFLVGTLGQEARLAPMLRAFCALPPVVLADLPGSTETVKVRGGEWRGTNYLYAVNTGDTPAEVRGIPLAPHELKVLEFALPPQARIEGGRLIVEIPPDTPPTNRKAHCALPLDLAPLLEGGRGVRASVRVSASGISEPDQPWNGAKFMFHYTDADSGEPRWPGAALPRGAFTNLLAETRVCPLAVGGSPEGGRAELILGLEGCTGRVEFDLSTLRLDREDWNLPRENEDYTVKYPDGNRLQSTADGRSQPVLLQGPSGLAGSPQPGGRRGAPLRGCMLPGRATTEEDIETLHRWGATLVRFQITRNWWKVDDNQDLEEYARWIDRRLDNLEDVLRWCAARGMKVCIDLHQPPGGKRGVNGKPYEMNLFHDRRYLEAFLDTWRRIARRCAAAKAACAPALQSAGSTIYGYDLINEPHQRGPAKFDYWTVQRLAAEAVREIDPDTPIIVECNLAARARAFRYLRPLAMDNVIYQCHQYEPTPYTHQGVAGSAHSTHDRPLAWPGANPAGGLIWDKEAIRRELAPVREFQQRHGARIYVGEFSAAAWAPGAENYLRDCIDLFEEYGWDWTYHAFREAPVWDVEKEALPDGSFADAPDTPRKRVLLDAFAR